MMLFHLDRLFERVKLSEIRSTQTCLQKGHFPLQIQRTTVLQVKTHCFC